MALLALFLSLRLSDRGGSLESPTRMAPLFYRKEFLHLAFLVFSQALAICISSNYMALLLARKGISLWRFFTPYAVGTLLVRGPLAVWVSKVSPKIVLVLGFSAMALSATGIVVFHDPSLVLICSFLFGMAFAPLQPTLISVAGEIIKYEKNALLTAVITSDDLAWAFGPLIGGFLGRSSIVFAYYGVVVVAAFAALMSMRCFGGPTKDSPPK